MRVDADVFLGDLNGAAIQAFWKRRGWTNARAGVIGCAVALVNYEPVGYCFVQAAENVVFAAAGATARAGVLSYVVHPDYAGHGLGRWLAGLAVQDAATRLTPDDLVFMQARKNNPASLAIGRHLGMLASPRAKPVIVRTRYHGEEVTVYLTLTSTATAAMAHLRLQMPRWEAQVDRSFGPIDHTYFDLERLILQRHAEQLQRLLASTDEEPDRVVMTATG